MKIKGISLILIMIVTNHLYSQEKLTDTIIKEREFILNNLDNYKRIEYYELDEFKEPMDMPIILHSKRVYFLNEKNEIVYIFTEKDTQTAFHHPKWYLSKNREEFFLKNDKLINYRKLSFINIPFNEDKNPQIDTVSNLNYLEQYNFKDTKIEIEEESFFYVDEICIKISKKEINTNLKNYRASLKSAPEIKLDEDIVDYTEFLGKKYIKELERLRSYLKGKIQKE